MPLLSSLRSLLHPLVVPFPCAWRVLRRSSIASLLLLPHCYSMACLFAVVSPSVVCLLLVCSLLFPRLLPVCCLSVRCCFPVCCLSVACLFAVVSPSVACLLLVCQSLFEDMDAIEYSNNAKDGAIEFADYLYVVGTYCMFGEKEIVKTVFAHADKDHLGYVTTNQFIALLNELYPFPGEKKMIRPPLISLELEPTSKMDFEQFYKNHKRYPRMFFPAFRIQERLRHATMGLEWFDTKLKKYVAVRQKMQNMASQATRLAELETQRFKEDEDRALRIAQRATEIKALKSGNGGSPIKLALLEARQFADEFT